MELYRIIRKDNSIEKINSSTLYAQGFQEPRDLETWVIKNKKNMFNKNILWIARQDFVTSEQRSDLIGMDENGYLIICELKRGTVDEHAITQALGYAAEYGKKNIVELSEMLLKHVRKGHIPGCQSEQMKTNDEASDSINKHVTGGKVGSDIEVNEIQTIVLVGEDFNPTALSISDYLNNSSDASTLVIECWKYELFPISDDEFELGFEQILPPLNIQKQIADKREEMRGKKYARNPKKMEFMRWLMNRLWDDPDFIGQRPGGASYYCHIQKASHDDVPFTFNVYEEYPRLQLPKLPFLSTLQFPNKIILHGADSEEPYLEFQDVKSTDLVPDNGFFDTIKGIIKSIVNGINT